MSKSKRQPKAQPTPKQVADTVRTNAQELYKHYRELLARSDSKDISAYAEAVAANEALGVLAYSIPPCAVEAFDSPMVRAYQAMHVLSLLSRAYLAEVREYGESLKNAPSTEEV